MPLGPSETSASPAAAFLLAYLPARGVACAAWRWHLEHAPSDADAARAQAMALSRRAASLEESKAAEVDARHRALAVGRARQLTESATALAQHLASTGLPRVMARADLVQNSVALAADVTSTSVEGLRRLLQFARVQRSTRAFGLDPLPRRASGRASARRSSASRASARVRPCAAEVPSRR